MIKMKKLIRSLVIASGGLFIAATASDAASISFRPTGAPIDRDPIRDTVTTSRQRINFDILVDTTGINANPNFNLEIDFSILLDPTELKAITFPSFNGSNFKATVLGNVAMGFITKYEVETSDDLINDGKADLSLIFNSAFLIDNNGVRGQNVSNSFGRGPGLVQTVEVQPRVPNQSVPEPTTMLSAAIALGWGGWLKRKNSSQQNKTNS